MNYILLTKDTIANYLHNTHVYNMIETNDSFEIPQEYYKETININTYDDFISYIIIFDYWGLDKLPIEFYKYVFNNKRDINIFELIEKFGNTNIIITINYIINYIKELYSDENNNTYLTFYNHFNYPINNLPEHITHLKFGNKFKQNPRIIKILNSYLTKYFSLVQLSK